MTTAPEHLRALQDQHVLQVRWSDRDEVELPYRLLRIECPCAVCIDEITGARLLRPETIPETIKPVKIDFVGNYAVKITWSDGHATGLYTWELLARLTIECRRGKG